MKVELDYEEFIERKSQLECGNGFDPVWMPDFLFDFQKALVEWALMRGRTAILADTGMGKTFMQLVWAENVVRHTGGKVLILAPLAVSHQTIGEAAKVGIEVRHVKEGEAHPGINIVNYERLHHFKPIDFVGCVCDESGRIKNFDSQGRKDITAFMRKMRYRLLCSATPAPNDYVELGTSAEALGYMSYTDMLERFFKNDQNNTKRIKRFSTGDKVANTSLAGGRGMWRFKGHAEQHFWRWVCSWARAMRKPSDLGFSDERFVLPSLTEEVHIVDPTTNKPGFLFDLPAVGLQEEREEAKRTIRERCEKVAELVNNTGKPGLIWCHLNDEGKLLSKLIPDSLEVAGSMSDDMKEDRLLGFTKGDFRVLITKGKIAGWGLNWQHCSHMTFFPSHSYEQYYQGVRRCWRFGQTQPVKVDVVATPGSALVQESLAKKSAAAERMMESLVSHMNDALHLSNLKQIGERMDQPVWLSTIK